MDIPASQLLYSGTTKLSGSTTPEYSANCLFGFRVEDRVRFFRGHRKQSGGVIFYRREFAFCLGTGIGPSHIWSTRKQALPLEKSIGELCKRIYSLEL
jgi:hypothetical protein